MHAAPPRVRGGQVVASDGTDWSPDGASPEGLSLRKEDNSGWVYLGPYFLQSGTGAVARNWDDKARDVASFEDFGAVGDGVTDDTTALTNAIASGKRIVGRRGRSYKFSSTLTLTDKHVDFGGATLLYVGAKNVFAMVINCNPSTYNASQVRNFLLKLDPTNTDTTTRTHGICLGGNLGVLDSARIEGFTGISLALGSGAESYTGVTLPASQQCYYWDISNIDIASTAGWNLVVRTANNTNHFRNFSTFPWNGFNTAAPRAANCIDEIAVGGTLNTFERISLEASPSNRMVLFLSTACGNQFLGHTYLETNVSWATPPYPRIEAQAQSSANRLFARMSVSAVVPILNLGTANDLRVVPGFYLNGSQVDLPRGGISLVKNGRFENGSNYWSDFSTAGAMSFGTGYLSGKSMRIDVVAGRPNVLQDLVAIGGYAVAALRDQDITVAGFVRTNLSGVSIKLAGSAQNQVPPDDAWHWFTSTIKVPTAAASVSVQLITETSGLTGYVEWSDVTAAFGNEPQVTGPRDLLRGSKTYDWPDLATASQQSTTVTVSGAALGDSVETPSMTTALNGTRLWGEVTATDTVTVYQRNDTGANVNVASGTLRVWVRKAT